MNDELKDFIKQLEEQDEGDVWFLTPGGVIHGMIVKNPSGSPKIITLSKAFYLTGGKATELGTATVRVDQILGWGMSPKNARRSTNVPRTLTAIVQKEGDLYVANAPEVGIVGQGQTIEEALENLKEKTDEGDFFGFIYHPIFVRAN